jgi:hypothetical protein
MTIAHAYTLLLEAAALATSFAVLWLSFWLRDRHRQRHHPVADFASDQQDGAIVGDLVLASVLGSGTRLSIDVVRAMSNQRARRIRLSCTARSMFKTLTTNHKFRPSKTNALSSKQ